MWGKFVVFAVLVTSSCWSFNFSSTNNQGKPIEINADNGIECDRETNVCTATGNVVISQNGITLKADRVTVHLKQLSEGHQTIVKAEVFGHVEIKSLDKPQTATAEYGVYNFEKGEARFTGNNLKLVFDTFSISAKDSLDFSEEPMIASAHGQAVAIKDGNKIEADVLQAHFKKDSQGHYVVDKVQALNDVNLKGENQLGFAKQGSYSHSNKRGQLEGDVHILSQEGVIVGEKAETDLEAKTSTVTGGKDSKRRVKMLIINQQARTSKNRELF